MSSSLAALHAERDTLLRSAREREAEASSLRQQSQQQQSSMDLERDRMNRELEALRAQLQQQVTGPMEVQPQVLTPPTLLNIHTALVLPEDTSAFWHQYAVVIERFSNPPAPVFSLPSMQRRN